MSSPARTEAFAPTSPVIHRGPIGDIVVAGLVAAVYAQHTPPVAVPVDAAFLAGLVRKAQAFDDGTTRLLAAVQAFPEATAEETPCSCHGTTDHDGLLDEWGRCPEGIADQDDDARAWIGGVEP